MLPPLGLLHPPDDLRLKRDLGLFHPTLRPSQLTVLRHPPDWFPQPNPLPASTPTPLDPMSGSRTRDGLGRQWDVGWLKWLGHIRCEMYPPVPSAVRDRSCLLFALEDPAPGLLLYPLGNRIPGRGSLTGVFRRTGDGHFRKSLGEGSVGKGPGRPTYLHFYFLNVKYTLARSAVRSCHNKEVGEGRTRNRGGTTEVPLSVPPEPRRGGWEGGLAWGDPLDHHVGRGGTYSVKRFREGRAG